MTLRQDETGCLPAAEPEPAAVLLAQRKLSDIERVNQQRSYGKMPGNLRGIAEPEPISLRLVNGQRQGLPARVAETPGQFAQALIHGDSG